MNRRKLLSLLEPLVQPLIAITIALFAGALVMLFTDESPLLIYGAMFKGAFGNKFYLLATLTRATPIIICGLGAAIAWSSQYMGIGGEGQMIWGGFCAAIVAIYLPGPFWLRLACALLAAMLAGGLYSSISAWLLSKFKMSLAISTLMMNYAAMFISMHFVQNNFLDKAADGKLIQTVMIDKALRFPRLFDNNTLHAGFIIAVALAFAMWFVMNRTVFGYESKMSGYNLNFCNYGGISSKRTMYLVLALSGAICGLAGAGEVMGVQYRYLHNSYVSSSFAWIGLNAALISNYNPIGILVTSIVLAGISTGGSAIARSMSVPLEISSVIQGCITLFISAKIAIQWRRRTARRKRDNPAPVTGLTQDGGDPQ